MDWVIYRCTIETGTVRPSDISLLPHAVKKADKEDKTKLLDKVDAFIFDCDGEIPTCCITDGSCAKEAAASSEVGALSMHVHL